MRRTKKTITVSRSILAELACVGRLLPDSNISVEPSVVAPKTTPDTQFPLGDTFEYTDPTQASRELEELMKPLDEATMAMWASAPIRLECVNPFQFSLA